MELNQSTLKEFRKKLKSMSNGFEKQVGEIIIKLVGEITLFPVDFYHQRTIHLEGEIFRPDYCIDIKNDDERQIIFIELKEYENISSNLIPQLEKFYRQLSKYKRDETYKDVKVHSLFVIASDDDLTSELTNRAINYGINIQKESVFLNELNDLVTEINPQYGFLDFLKNKFNIRIIFEPQYLEKYGVQNKTFDTNLLTFTMTGRELLRLSYVYRAANTADEKELRYQRLIDGDRLNEIKKFITNKNFVSVFPNNLICSFADDCDCQVDDTELPDIKKIKFENRYSSLWIIDGQHRLFSLAKLKAQEENLLDEYHYTVTAYKTIKPKDQAKIFFFINNEQTGINANLVCYILAQLREDKEGASANIALLLENAGVFRSKIYKGITREGGYKKTWLNLKTFVDHLSPSNDKKKPDDNLIGWEDEKRGWLQNHERDLDMPLDILINYFQSVKETFPSDWNKNNKSFVQNNVGISVFLKILLKILKKECNYGNPESVSRMTKSIFNRHLKKYDKRINAKVPDLPYDEWRYVRNKS